METKDGDIPLRKSVANTALADRKEAGHIVAHEVHKVVEEVREAGGTPADAAAAAMHVAEIFLPFGAVNHSSSGGETG